MWNARLEDLPRQTTRIVIESDGLRLSFLQVLELLEYSASFATFLTSTLAASSLDAFFWEWPPLIDDRLNASFESVLVAAPALVGKSADAHAFAGQFERAGSDAPVVTFANIGGDATLIVPTPEARNHRCYSHLASFVRLGPDQQVVEFWHAVGRAALSAMSSHPIWISTSGTGVSWLHLRLDSRPKYYQYTAYRRSP
jgi:hypothetical protein